MTRHARKLCEASLTTVAHGKAVDRLRSDSARSDRERRSAR